MTSVVNKIDSLLDYIETTKQYRDIQEIDSLQQSYVIGKFKINIHGIQIDGLNDINRNILQNAINKIHNKYEQLQSVIILNDSKIFNDFIGIPINKIKPTNIIFDDALTFDKAFNKELDMNFDINDHTKPLYRFRITTKDEYLLFSTHHALFDGRARIPIINDFLTLINNPDAFKDIIIKNSVFYERLLKDEYIKDQNKFRQFRVQLYQYGGANKLFNDIKLNTNNIRDNLDKYFSDKGSIYYIIGMCKAFGVIDTNPFEDRISLTNPSNTAWNPGSGNFVFKTIPKDVNLGLIKLCKQHKVSASILYFYIYSYAIVYSIYTMDQINQLSGKKINNGVIRDLRLFFDENKVKKYYGSNVTAADLIGCYVASVPQTIMFDVNIKIGSTQFWEYLRDESIKVNSKNIGVFGNTGMFYEKELAILKDESKYKYTTSGALTTMGAIKLNKNDYKYKATVYHRACSGLEYYGFAAAFSTCIKDIGTYNICFNYSDNYATKQKANNIADMILNISKQLTQNT